MPEEGDAFETYCFAYDPDSRIDLFEAIDICIVGPLYQRRPHGPHQVRDPHRYFHHPHNSHTHYEAMPLPR